MTQWDGSETRWQSCVGESDELIGAIEPLDRPIVSGDGCCVSWWWQADTRGQRRQPGGAAAEVDPPRLVTLVGDLGQPTWSATLVGHLGRPSGWGARPVLVGHLAGGLGQSEGLGGFGPAA